MGVFYAMKHQLPQMERQFKADRRKAAPSSTSLRSPGLVGAPRLSVYAAAKHGVVGLTRSAAAEYATKGIRVNAVCPAYARTAMVAAIVRVSGAPEAEAHGRADARRADEAGGGSRRGGRGDPVRRRPGNNSFMTGHALAVDGGVGAI